MKNEPNRIPPEHTRPYGVEEIHAVILRHRDDQGGVGISIVVMLPEAADTFEGALAQTKGLHARLSIVCDTARQAKRARKRAIKYLKGWVEVPYSEVMPDAARRVPAAASCATIH